MATDIVHTARLEAICEIQAAMFIAAGQAVARHGDDPEGAGLLAAATAMFIDKIDANLLPGFKAMMIAMIGKDQ